MSKTGTIENSTELKSIYRATVPVDFKWLSVVNRAGADRTLDLYFKPAGGIEVPVCEGPLVLNDGNRAIEDQPRQLTAGDEFLAKTNGAQVSFELEVVER